MKPTLRCVLLVALPVLTLPALADPADLSKLGTIHFTVQADATTREHVVRGVKLLHHMMYVEADREFAAALARDPDCGFGYWGRAMAIVHPLWPDVPATADLAQGRQHVTAGLDRSLRTARERAYLSTMEAFFRDPSEPSLPARLKAADEAWAAVAATFPDDLDAAAFAALFHLAPARFLPKDKSYRLQLQSANALQAVLAGIPDHPGALHYKIHAFDFPLLAGRALEVCEQYGSIAPDVPHALHMPTHIFTRRGQWDQSIDFNNRSAESARAMAHDSGTLNSHLPHALDYLAYAHLQRAEYERAVAVQRELLALSGPYQATNRPAMAYAFAAVPARLALERRDWASATRLELRQPASFPWSDAYLNCDAIVRFARGLGAVRSGNIELGQRELAEAEKLQARIAATLPGSYWATQSAVQLSTLRAWIALRQGDTAKALTHMRTAVDAEATTDKEAVTPGEVVPAGELFGEMLIELGRNEEALAAYEAQLELSPRRFHSVFGAALAAERLGDRLKAASYFRQLASIAPTADPGNERLGHAREFLDGAIARR